MGDTFLGRSMSEQNLGVQVDCELNMKSQCDAVAAAKKKTNAVLACYQQRHNIQIVRCRSPTVHHVGLAAPGVCSRGLISKSSSTERSGYRREQQG